MVGGTLAPSLRDAGVFGQASHVRRRRLPRLAQLFIRRPHLANRYVNLMAFAERHAPEQQAALVAALGVDLPARTPHRSWHPSRRRLLTPAAGALATALVIAAAAYLLPDGTMTGAEAKPDATGALVAHVPPSFAGSARRARTSSGRSGAAWPPPWSAPRRRRPPSTTTSTRTTPPCRPRSTRSCTASRTPAAARTGPIPAAGWRAGGSGRERDRVDRRGAADPRAGRRARYGARRAPALVAARFGPSLTFNSR